MEQSEVEALRLAARHIVDAWTVEGPKPKLHREAQRNLAAEWPTLYGAIVDLVEQVQR